MATILSDAWFEFCKDFGFVNDATDYSSKDIDNGYAIQHTMHYNYLVDFSADFIHYDNNVRVVRFNVKYASICNTVHSNFYQFIEE